MPIAENRKSILNDSPNALIAINAVAPTIINENVEECVSAHVRQQNRI